jgi:iron(III) transport system substrate-binding protein
MRRPPRQTVSRPGPWLAGLLLVGLAACGREPDVIVYCALDQIFSQEMLARFERESGLEVRAEYDTEASKTVGLVRRLIEEKNRTRCDVFWNNEIAQTARLARLGLLQPYDSPSAEGIPAHFRDPNSRWTGFAARARVFIVNTELADPNEIKGMWDLLDPKWKGKVGVARPLTGTTLTHAAALYDVIGEQQAQDYWTRIVAANKQGDVQIVSSNGQLMRLVGSGELAWGWTDTDDFNVARIKGKPVAVVYPDQEGEDAIGALIIPNTVAIMKHAPHLEAARRFVDWVLSEETEAALAAADSAQIPVRAHVPRPEHVRSLESIRVMQVSYVAIGLQIAQRTKQFKELFLQ